MLDARKLKIFLLIAASATFGKHFGFLFRPFSLLRTCARRNRVRRCSSKSMCATDLEYLSNVSGVNGLALPTSDEAGSTSDRVDDRDLIMRAEAFTWNVLRGRVSMSRRRRWGILQPRKGRVGLLPRTDVPWKKDDSLLCTATAGSRRTAAVGFRACGSCMLTEAVIKPPQSIVSVSYRENVRRAWSR